MALRINGIDGNYSVPNVLSRVYRCTKFQPTLVVTVKTDGKSEDITVVVKPKILESWSFVTDKATAHKACNDYFKSLKRGKTLKEILAEGDITLHCLAPKEGHTYDELPDGVTAGRDIGIDPALLLRKDRVPTRLTAVLIHELAHVGGATTDKGAADAIAAETALKHCLCAGQFQPDSLGSVQRTGVEKRVV